MSQVQLDLILDIGSVRSQIAAAEGLFARLKAQGAAGVSLRLGLDASSFYTGLETVKATAAKTEAKVKVSTEFYKVGSGKSISASALLRDVIRPVQTTVDKGSNYKVKIGTELRFDADSLRQIAEITRKAQAAVDASTKNIGAAREKLVGLTNTESKGGLNASGIRRLKTAAGSAGLQIGSTSTTGMRKELKQQFENAGDEIIEGLIKGLTGKQSDVIDKTTQAGKDIIKTFKKILGISSPSKETKKIGEWTAEGFGQGFLGGMVQMERQMAQAIRQAVANAFQDGLARDQAARGAMADFGKSAGTAISTSLVKSLKQGLASSVGPALKGGLLGATGGAATGGLLGGLGATGAAVKEAVMPSMLTFGYGSLGQKAGMLGDGAKALASGGANEAFTDFLHNSINSVLDAAMSSGGHGALLGAAGVAGVAGMAGLAKGAGGSLVTQAIDSIKNRILGAAVEQAKAQANVQGSTGGAVAAPIQNAGNIFGALQSASGTVVKGLINFAKELTPGALQQRIVDIAWSLDQAAEQFGVVKRDAAVLSGKIQNTWRAFSNNVPEQLLPQTPVPGTGLMRQEDMQLGSVVGRTPLGFQGAQYGALGGRIGPADIDGGRGYIEQSRKSLQAIAGKPGEWEIIDEVNGIWRRIKTDAELAQERQAIIARNMASAAKQANSTYRTWTDREGVGTFNPFDQAFYRGARNEAPYSMSGSDITGSRSTLGGTFSGSRGGGDGGKTTDVYRRATQERPGALATRNIPVEFFKSFRDAEKLLAEVERRLSAVAAAFGRLGVVSQLQVDQNIRSLSVSLEAVSRGFDKGEISASDYRAALYGATRAMSGMDTQTAEVQNLAQAFQNLGIQSRAALESIEKGRDIDLQYIKNELGPNSSEGLRARNARDIQQLSGANELVRGAQGASGFGGFRGREIGNDVLNKAQKTSELANYVRSMKEYSSTLELTGSNSKTYQRVQGALNEEIDNASRAFRVLNGEAKAGETIAHVARNAWGTILDDFQNLVPQLLVFAVAYNLILQRVMTTPGAVIQAAAAFDKLETSISSYLSATRGIGDTSGVIGDLQQVALDLGIGFEKAGQSYLRFAAATQGTSLEGQEVDITRTLATAARNQGLSGEQIDRSSVALTQILGKGRVQMEELRGQLAEQLPGALQVAARAFGVTTKELYRMVEAGQIAGDDFVGKFINQLKSEGADTNQLSGTFSSVSEQLGSSVQALAATAGKPLLAGLTVGLQAVNAVIQALIPLAPVVTGLFLVLGASALKAALGHVPLVKELWAATAGMFAGKGAAEGYTAGMVKLAGAVRVVGTALATFAKAALIGLAIGAIGKAIEYMRGEVGSLGDELKKVQKIADGGKGEGLNGMQKFMGNLNIGQNINDSTTYFDAAKIGDSTVDLGKKIKDNEGNIKRSADEMRRIDKQLFDERLRRDQAEANREEKTFEDAKKRIIELEKARNSVQFAVSPEDAQNQIGAMKAAEQAVQKIIDRGKALEMKSPLSTKGSPSWLEEKELKRLQDVRKGFEEAAKAAGLLDTAIMKVNSLGALQSKLKGIQELLPTVDVNSETYRQLQLEQVGTSKAIGDQQLLPQERVLKTQEETLRRMSTELKVQENVQRIKLGLIENEKRVLESSLELERTRGRLREVVAQRKVDVAGAVNAPEEMLAAEAQVRKIREANQARELKAQSGILNKDKERINIESTLQKKQIEIQTQQLEIDKQMLAIEKIRIEAAMKQNTISADLKKAYGDQLVQINGTLKATEALSGQEGALLNSVDRQRDAQLQVLGIKQQELGVQQQINATQGLTAGQLERIKAAQQDINNKQQAALATVQQAKAVLDQQQQAVESQMEAVRASVDLQKERARLAQESAQAEMGLVDRLIELQTGRNEGGFFERIAKASLLGASGEQEAYDLAQRRMALMQQVQASQIQQKQLELDLKKKELEAEKAINELKVQGLRIANEEAKINLRNSLETMRLKLATIGASRTPDQNNQYQAVTGALQQLGGYNSGVKGNSTNVEAFNLAGQATQLSNFDKLLTDMESNGNRVYGERTAALDLLIQGETKLLGVQQQLGEMDVTQWFAQFLDQSTLIGRTLGVVTTELENFRSTVSKTFADAIVNGQNASDAIADAAKSFAGNITAGLIDELVMKPMQENFFKGMALVFGYQKSQTPDEKIASNTQTTAGHAKQTADNVASLGTKLDGIQSTIERSTQAVADAIKGIAKPTMETPVYRAPENTGFSSTALPAGYTANVVGGVANMLPGTKGGPNINEGVGTRGGRHKGQDLGLDPGDPIHARMAGVVTDIFKSFGGIGDAIVMKYANGQEGRYGHVDPSVRIGDPITTGQKIATVTNDGQNTHLHYELRDAVGKLLNPLNAIKQSLAVAPGTVSGGASATAFQVEPKKLEPAAMPPLSSVVPSSEMGQVMRIPVESFREAGQSAQQAGTGVDSLGQAAQAGATSSQALQQSFDMLGVSLLTFKEALDLAAASGMNYSGGTGFASGADLASSYQGSSGSDAASWGQSLGVSAEELTQSQTDAANSIRAAGNSANGLPQAFNSMGGAMQGFMGILGSVGMGIAGIGMMSKGGTYNTLMGLSGIFGALGGIFGGFGGFFADGGSVAARTPIVVGEKGPELFVPTANGEILTNRQTASLLSGSPDTFTDTRASLSNQRQSMATKAAESSSAFQMTPIDVRYESQVINNVEYVTSEQHRKGMDQAAKRGQLLSYQGMQNSLKVRKRIGIA